MFTSPITKKPRLDEGVAAQSLAYKEMAKVWHLPETLWGGTAAMRAAGKTYLPQQPKESDDAYRNRLERTFLLNLYRRTITTVTGIAFIKPIVINHVPAELEYLEFNIDGTGRNITEFAYDLAVTCLHLGVVHVMVDFPNVSQDDELSIGQFEDNGFQPYFSMVHPTRLVGWKTDKNSSFPKLKQVRITSDRLEDSDTNEWMEKVVDLVYVVTANNTTVYRFDPEAGSNEVVDETFNHTLGKIPLVTAYSNKTGFMTAEPPLLDLAYTNLAHYQSGSDQRNILHIARVPFLLGTGFEEGELENTEIGANRIILATNENANIKHIEHTGQAIGAGRTDLKDLESQMGMLGADLLISKSVSRQTATARRMDQSESMSTLQLTLRSIEQMLEQAYFIAGEWLGVDASEVSISIGDDLSVVTEPNPTNALIALKDSGLLTDEQVIDEAKRQGILSSYFKLSPDRPSENEPEVVEVLEQDNQDVNLAEPDELSELEDTKE